MSFGDTFSNHCLRLIHKEGFFANETWVADETELKANANKRIRETRFEENILEGR